MNTKLKLIALAAAALCAFSTTTQAGAVTGFAQDGAVLVDSATGQATGASAAWSASTASGASVTNFTRVDISGAAKEVALQFTVASTNATTTSNVVWYVFRSAEAVSVTNAAGTSLRYDALGRVTNIMAGATANTTVATFTAGLEAAKGNQSAHTGIAGLKSLYIGYVEIPALSGLTNYSIRVSQK